MVREIKCDINDKEVTLLADLRLSLAEMLRQNGYFGVKIGCGVGECGACTVLVDGLPVDSCLYLAIWAQGKNIRTVEGEAREGRLSPVQQAYVEEGAVQCGFCTPGFIMTSTAFVEKHQGRACTREEIRQGHSGNLCRCTGYENIIRAVERCQKEDLDKETGPDQE